MKSGGSLTGSEVRQAVFAKPPLGKRGYRAEDVDRFMERAADALDGIGALTADEVHHVVFPMATVRGDRGYREDEVDAMLDVVAAILRRRAGENSPVTPAPNAEPLSGYRIRQTVLARSRIGTAGYDTQQVDEFIERAANTLDGSGVPLSVDQVQGASFDRAKGLRRGYRIDDVDALLDRVTAELRRRSAGW